MIFRKAKITDVEEIHALINYYAERGLMLARPRTQLYEGLREFTIAEEQERLVGAGSLHITWDNLAEIRALAVTPEQCKNGIGRKLVDLFLEEARELALPRVFALTYQQKFFEKCGFNTIPKESLPQKVWRECVNCPKFPYCDEIAMIVNL
jgi:amino-acid N-acetyltransferase